MKLRENSGVAFPGMETTKPLNWCLLVRPAIKDHMIHTMANLINGLPLIVKYWKPYDLGTFKYYGCIHRTIFLLVPFNPSVCELSDASICHERSGALLLQAIRDPDWPNLNTKGVQGPDPVKLFSRHFFKWANPSLFLFIFVIFSIQFQ